MRLNIITLAAVLIAAALFALHWRQVPRTPLHMAGTAIAGASLLLLTVARLQLGSAFSARARARKLVTTGLYAKFRNPVYIFGEGFILGLALLDERARPLLLLFAAVMVPLQIWRARNEARVLREAFGEEYDRYRAQTWF